MQFIWTWLKLSHSTLHQIRSVRGVFPKILVIPSNRWLQSKTVTYSRDGHIFWKMANLQLSSGSNCGHPLSNINTQQMRNEWRELDSKSSKYWMIISEANQMWVQKMSQNYCLCSDGSKLISFKLLINRFRHRMPYSWSDNCRHILY